MLAQFEAPFIADEESMRREAAQRIGAQIASTSLEPEPPDGRKKVRNRACSPTRLWDLLRY